MTCHILQCMFICHTTCTMYAYDTQLIMMKQAVTSQCCLICDSVTRDPASLRCSARTNCFRLESLIITHHPKILPRSHYMWRIRTCRFTLVRKGEIRANPPTLTVWHERSASVFIRSSPPYTKSFQDLIMWCTRRSTLACNGIRSS